MPSSTLQLTGVLGLAAVLYGLYALRSGFKRDPPGSRSTQAPRQGRQAGQSLPAGESHALIQAGSLLLCPDLWSGSQAPSRVGAEARLLLEVNHSPPHSSCSSSQLTGRCALTWGPRETARDAAIVLSLVTMRTMSAACASVAFSCMVMSVSCLLQVAAPWHRLPGPRCSLTEQPASSSPSRQAPCTSLAPAEESSCEALPQQFASCSLHLLESCNQICSRALPQTWLPGRIFRRHVLQAAEYLASLVHARVRLCGPFKTELQTGMPA